MTRKRTNCIEQPELSQQALERYGNLLSMGYKATCSDVLDFLDSLSSEDRKILERHFQTKLSADAALVAGDVPSVRTTRGDTAVLAMVAALVLDSPVVVSTVKTTGLDEEFARFVVSEGASLLKKFFVSCSPHIVICNRKVAESVCNKYRAKWPAFTESLAYGKQVDRSVYDGVFQLLVIPKSELTPVSFVAHVVVPEIIRRPNAFNLTYNRVVMSLYRTHSDQQSIMCLVPAREDVFARTSLGTYNTCTPYDVRYQYNEYVSKLLQAHEEYLNTTGVTPLLFYTTTMDDRAVVGGLPGLQSHTETLEFLKQVRPAIEHVKPATKNKKKKKQTNQHH